MMKRFLCACALLSAITMAHATTVPNTSPYQSFLNPNTGGLPCAGCSIYSYSAGTTNALATYTDSTGGSQNTNPIVLDSGGGAQIWLGASCYKLILKDTGGSTIWTADNVCPVIAQGAPLSVTSLTTTQLNLTYTPAPGSTLQAVINTASANSAISLSCGTYTVSAGLTMSSNNVRLSGPTRDCAFINFTSNTGLTVSGTGVEISGITFEGATLHGVTVTSAATGGRFHDNTVTQGGAVAGSLPAGVWLQAGLSDFVLERNNLTGNGPASFSSGNATGYTILTSGTATGFLTNIRIQHNRIWANNSAIAIAGFDCSFCKITDNFVDQNNVWDGSEGSGYGIQDYSEGYALTTTSLSRTSNVVTAVVTTQQAGEPWTIGETVMATAYGFGGSGSNFNGVFTLTGASGTGPYTLTWAQTAPDDSVTGAALGGVTQPPLQHILIASNIITNTAGACIYIQGGNDAVINGNELSQCDKTITPSALLHAGISITGMWRGTITGNSVDTVGHSSAYYLTHTYSATVSGNVGVNAHLDGLRTVDNYDLAVTGNTFANNADGGIVGPSTTRINSYHSTFANNDIYLAPSTDGYHFDGLDQYDKVTGGAVHGPPSGTSNAALYATSTTADITVGEMEADCYADGGTVKGINYGIRSAGTRITMKSNRIVGCAVDGILDVGTNDDIEQNNITGSITGIVASASTGVTILGNYLVGNSTALTTAGATNPIVASNVLTIGTLPVVNGSAIQVNGNTVLSSTQTGIQGNGVNVATAAGSFTFHHLRQTDSGGAEADTPVDSTTVVQRIINCNTGATCSNNLPANGWIVEGGPIAMAAGTITITGISPAFTSNATFTCRSWDLTTPANTTACALVSGSSITITGTGTDSVTYLLIGN